MHCLIVWIFLTVLGLALARQVLLQLKPCPQPFFALDGDTLQIDLQNQCNSHHKFG
jgi:hypothetical protein